ncbi:hypothetical protein [Xanthomonas campestris]|uniref:hypothetical protein n=1 Tax=Xanthomonas campestris TaxID=339 RepID=UPI000E1E4661|nr:hypothetical protein [Xanthomonas campestris]MCC5064029.1 hypothetical protein [Xanthomonas campestris pv. raphani]MCC5066977.1 hypothetical protein [Xanthomonas campestris]MCC8486063.1 hypothetical protein [Xanthomonas campestris]MDM7669009.1 hypothetical protein [Xanthomonas campestris pv. campestris]MDM7689946.1 hypothetical protein [Xanthomonas campestris pv. campestris]
MWKASLAYLAVISAMTVVVLGLLAVSSVLYRWTFFALMYLLVASAPVLLASGATAHLQRVVLRVASATLLASALYGMLYLLIGTFLLWPGVLCAPLLILFLEWRRARRLRPASNDVQPA